MSRITLTVVAVVALVVSNKAHAQLKVAAAYRGGATFKFVSASSSNKTPAQTATRMQFMYTNAVWVFYTNGQFQLRANDMLPVVGRYTVAGGKITFSGTYASGVLTGSTGIKVTGVIQGNAAVIQHSAGNMNAAVVGGIGYGSSVSNFAIFGESLIKIK